MDLKLYRALGTLSRRAISRKFKRYGKPYIYRPRGTLIERLSKQFNMSKDDVYQQLMKEREFILKYSNYY